MTNYRGSPTTVGPRQHNDSWFRTLWDSRLHFIIWRKLEAFKGLNLEINVKVIFRATVSRPLCLGLGRYVGHPTNFSFTSMEIIFCHFGVSYCGAACLTKGWVCNLQLPLGLASPVIVGVSVARNSQSHFTASNFHTHPPNLVGQVPVFISPNNWVAQL
jgi:hypothetical protein